MGQYVSVPVPGPRPRPLTRNPPRATTTGYGVGVAVPHVPHDDGGEVSLSQAFAAAFERNAPRWVDGQRLPSHTNSNSNGPVPSLSQVQSQSQNYRHQTHPNQTLLSLATANGHARSHGHGHDHVQPTHVQPLNHTDGNEGETAREGEGDLDLFLGRRPSIPQPLSFPISLNSSAGQDPFSRAVSPIGRRFSVGTDYFKSVDQHDQRDQRGQVPGPLVGSHNRLGAHESGQSTAGGYGGEADVKSLGFGQEQGPNSGLGSGGHTPSIISIDINTDSDSETNGSHSRSDHQVGGVAVAVVDYAYTPHTQTQTSGRPDSNPHEERTSFWTSPPSPKSQPPSLINTHTGQVGHLGQLGSVGSGIGIGMGRGMGMNGRRPSLHTFLGTSIHTPLFPDHLSQPFFSRSGAGGGDQSPTLFDGPMDQEQEQEPDLDHDHQLLKDQDPMDRNRNRDRDRNRDQTRRHESDDDGLSRVRISRGEKGRVGGEGQEGQEGQSYFPTLDHGDDKTLPRFRMKDKVNDSDRGDDDKRRSGDRERDEGSGSGMGTGRRTSVLWPNIGAVGRLSLSKGSEVERLGLGLGLALDTDPGPEVDVNEDTGGYQWK